MDTKPLEIQSESFIQSQLIKYGFKTVKPSFDIEGADLLIIDNITNQFTKILKVQCKGRSVNERSSNIKIPIKYVVENFIVFLYTIDRKKEEKLFIYFKEDIEKWNKNNGNYILSFTEKNFCQEKFIEKEFNENFTSLMQNKINKSEEKKYTTIIIDGLFLNKSVRKTINFYQDIYPNKKFTIPSLKDVIINILTMYDTFHSQEKIIRCSFYFNDDSIYNEELNVTFTINRDSDLEIKVCPHKTEDFITFEIIDDLPRIINTENIILVADDITYEESLNSLKDKNIDITLVMFTTNDGRQMFSEHKWGDITYPIAKAIGLQDHEW